MRNYVISAIARALSCLIRITGQENRLGSAIKIRIFDRYFGWRKIKTSARTSFGSTMNVDLPDSIQTSIFLTGKWDPEITTLIEKKLSYGDIFVDVGANVGYFTLLASKKVGMTGRVHAIEASPQIFHKLIDNIELNSITNAIPKNAAVSSTAGNCQIWSAPIGNVGHTTIMSNVARQDGHTIETTVPCNTLTSLIPESDLFRARLVKVDIEGAEKLLVLGIRHRLSEFSDNTEWIIELSSEFSPEGYRDVELIFGTFTAAGYKAYLIDRHQPRHGGVSLTELHAPPSGRLCDVLFSKA